MPRADKHPLHLAAADGNSMHISELLAAGADVNARDRQNQTPLHLAALSGEAQAVEQLLSAGADVTACDENGNTALHAATKHCAPATCVDLLLAAGAEVNAANQSGETPLLLAAAHNSVPIVQRLLAAGADVNAVGDRASGHSALHVAAARGDLAMVNVLLAAGADADARNCKRDTPLLCAAYGAAPPAVLEALLAAEALWPGWKYRVHAADDSGLTALGVLAGDGTAEHVKLLLEAGASLQLGEWSARHSQAAIRMSKRTPLWRAVLGRNVGTFQTLVDRLPVAATAANITGGMVAVRQQILQDVVSEGWLEGVQVLLAAGWQVEGPGTPALHFARSEQMVRLLPARRTRFGVSAGSWRPSDSTPPL